MKRFFLAVIRDGAHNGREEEEKEKRGGRDFHSHRHHSSSRGASTLFFFAPRTLSLSDARARCRFGTAISILVVAASFFSSTANAHRAESRLSARQKTDSPSLPRCFALVVVVGAYIESHGGRKLPRAALKRRLPGGADGGDPGRALCRASGPEEAPGEKRSF